MKKEAPKESKPVGNQNQQSLSDLKLNIQFSYINSANLLLPDDKYNLLYLKQCLVNDQIPTKTDLMRLLDRFSNIIRYEQNMVRINGNVTVIGDIHGQFPDFMKCLNIINTHYSEICNSIKNDHLLFLGDYVDRGVESIEVMTFIMALKINNPKTVFCLRGNHESRIMTVIHNFKLECLAKYDQQIYERFLQMFDLLPIACTVNNSFFCVHGGISDKLSEIKQINKLNRYQEIPPQGPFCDFMWADPYPIQQTLNSRKVRFNNHRLCSIFFGTDLGKSFLNNNKLLTIVRAHQVFPEGYQRRNWNQQLKNVPSVITIFSAPNYCGMYGNKAAILRIKDDNNMEVRQFKEQKIQEKIKSELQIQVFSWTMPQIIRVINSFAQNLTEEVCEVLLKNQFPSIKSLNTHQKIKLFLNYKNAQKNPTQHNFGLTHRKTIYYNKQEKQLGELDFSKSKSMQSIRSQINELEDLNNNKQI